jgi:hypothetical protein
VVIPPGGDATAAHDVTLWCGDLNYRIRGNHRAVMFSIQRSLHEVLHANDQLRLQLKKGKVFEVRRSREVQGRGSVGGRRGLGVGEGTGGQLVTPGAAGRAHVPAVHVSAVLHST